MASLVLSSAAIIGAFLVVVLFGGLVVAVAFDAIDSDRPDVLLALLAVALLAYYVGYRVGGL